MRYQSASVLTVMSAAGTLALAAGAARAGTIESRWLNAQSGIWSDSLNWSTDPFPDDGSPNPGDRYRAIIDAAGAAYSVMLQSPVTLEELVIDSDDATLEQASFLTIDRGSLVRGRHRVGAGAVLQLNDEYGVDGELEVFGGNLFGLGALRFNAGGSGRFEGNILQTLTVHNAGTVTHHNAAFLLTGSAGIHNAVGGVLETTGADVSYNKAQSVANIINAGLFLRSGVGMTSFGGGDPFVDNGGVLLDNTGEVRAEAGTIRIAGGGASSGLFHADAGATIEFLNRHTFENGFALEGDGEFRFGEGRFTLNAPWVNTTTTSWEGSKIESAVGITNEANLSFTDLDFSFADAPYPVQNLAGATLSVTRGVPNWDLTNSGLIEIFSSAGAAPEQTTRAEQRGGSANLAGGEIVLHEHAQLELDLNAGLIRMFSESSIPSTTRNPFQNGGEIRSMGEGVRIENIVNTGSLLVESGDLTTKGDFGGSVVVSDGATLVVKTQPFQGGGFPETPIGTNVVVEQGGVLFADNAMVSIGSLDSIAGELRLKGSVVFPEDIAIDERVTFSEYSALTIDGDLRFVSDHMITLLTIDGSGSVLVEPGVEVTLEARTGSDTLVPWTNEGTTSFETNSELKVGGFVNTSIGVVNLLDDVRISSDVDSGFVNHGELNSSGVRVRLGGSPGLFNPETFVSDGAINVTSGDLTIAARGSLGGMVSVSSGASLDVWATTQPAGGVIDSDGSVRLGLQTTSTTTTPVEINGAVHNTGELTMAGLVTVNSALSLGGDVIFRETVDGAGSIQLTGHARFEQASVGPSGGLTITENATAEVVDGLTLIQTDLASDGTLGLDALSSIEVGGSLSLGAPGTLSVDHDFGSRGALSSITVAGIATIDGALEVAAFGMPALVPGQGFTLLTASSVTGVFSGFSLPPLAPGYSWEVGYGATSVTLNVVPEPAALAPLLLLALGRRRRTSGATS